MTKEYIFGLLAGSGCGLLAATVFYRHNTVDALTDPLRIVGFLLLFVGGAMAARMRAYRTAQSQSPNTALHPTARERGG